MNSPNFPPPIATAISSTILLILLLLLIYLHFSHRHISSSSSPTLLTFSYRSLRSSTLHFHPSRSLGRGAYSSVFLGILPDGKFVAIKRINRDSLNELKVFVEMPQSPFIVSLLGYCKRKSCFLLVYEYMCNGSLQEALFGYSRFFIDWERRFGIILDVAKGLFFLHFECDPPVIHGDVKPSNVLLGFDFKAKLGDFGLSRRKDEIFGGDFVLSPRVEKERNFVSSSCCDCELGGSSPLDDGRIDYVREWIGNQNFRLKNPDWDDDRKSSPELRSSDRLERIEQKRLDETVVNQDEDKKLKANGEAQCEKERKMREWWKEEYFAEISEKGKKNKRLKWFENNKLGELDVSFKKGWKKKKKKDQSVSSEVQNSELYSKELSSTTSMRGTVCYVAPENGGFSHAYEKADIYSFGVLILVIVSGRRPLHVQESPMKLDRANLISWCRQLALVGDELDILDENLKDSCDKDQVNLCIKLALLCLQRTPELRPDSGEIVKILNGEMEIPVVPLDYSNSPISRSKRRNKQDSE